MFYSANDKNPRLLILHGVCAKRSIGHVSVRDFFIPPHSTQICIYLFCYYYFFVVTFSFASWWIFIGMPTICIFTSFFFTAPPPFTSRGEEIWSGKEKEKWGLKSIGSEWEPANRPGTDNKASRPESVKKKKKRKEKEERWISSDIYFPLLIHSRPVVN